MLAILRDELALELNARDKTPITQWCSTMLDGGLAGRWTFQRRARAQNSDFNQSSSKS